MSERATPEADARFEALRARWEHAKATSTTLAFAEEMMADAVPVPESERTYESEDERDLYAEVRAKCPVTANDLLGILPCYFGDEPAIPMEDFLRTLEQLESQVAGEGANESFQP